MKSKFKSDNNIYKSLNAMEKLYSKKYGLSNFRVTNDFNHVNVSVGSDKYMIGSVVPLFSTSVRNTNYDVLYGGASALTIGKSKVKAYGEFIERYCAASMEFNSEIDVIFDSYNNLQKTDNCLDFEKLIHFEDDLYSCPDFPYHKYSKDTCILWVKGKNLIKNSEVWLPAQKVFLGIKLMQDELQYITWISTGLACETSYNRAVINSLCEVVERDSFMLTWLLKLQGTRIIIDKISNKELKLFYDHVCKYLTGEDELFIYDISKTEGVYTILTFIKNKNPDSFGLVVAAAAYISPEKAILKSLEELCQTQAFAYGELIKNKKCKFLKEEDVTNLEKHTLYYSNSSRSYEIDFMLESDNIINLSEMEDFCIGTDEDIFKYLVKVFERNNEEVFVADITMREIRECGFCVVRSIVSGYNDLDYSHKFRHLKNERLKIYQKEYNKQINNAPHPFP